MPVKLYTNTNRFKTIRSGSAIANDSPVPPIATFPDDQRFDSDGCDYIIFHWTAATPTGTPTFTVYLWDGDAGIFVKGDAVTGLAPNTLAKVAVHGASNAVLLISAAGGGTNFKVNAFGCMWHS